MSSPNLMTVLGEAKRWNTRARPLAIQKTPGAEAALQKVSECSAALDQARARRNSCKGTPAWDEAKSQVRTAESALDSALQCKELESWLALGRIGSQLDRLTYTYKDGYVPCLKLHTGGYTSSQHQFGKELDIVRRQVGIQGDLDHLQSALSKVESQLDSMWRSWLDSPCGCDKCKQDRHLSAALNELGDIARGR